MTGVLVAAGLFAVLCVPATAGVARAMGPGRSVTTLAGAVAAVLTAYVGWSLAGLLVLVALAGCKPDDPAQGARYCADGTQVSASDDGACDEHGGRSWYLMCYDGTKVLNTGKTSCDEHRGIYGGM